MKTEDLILQELKGGPLSARDLIDILEKSQSGVHRALKLLQGKKLIRVAGYDRQPDGVGGAFITRFALANGRPNARKPEPWDSNQRSARYYERHKAVRLVQDKLRKADGTGFNIWRGLM